MILHTKHIRISPIGSTPGRGGIHSHLEWLLVYLLCAGVFFISREMFMRKTNVKPIKPGKRAYSMKDVIGNLKEFKDTNRFGNVQLKLHNGEYVMIDMFPKVSPKRGF